MKSNAWRIPQGLINADLYPLFIFIITIIITIAIIIIISLSSSLLSITMTLKVILTVLKNSLPLVLLLHALGWPDPQVTNERQW